MINDFRGLLKTVKTVGVNVSVQEKKWAQRLLDGVDLVDPADLIIGTSNALYDVSESGEIRRVVIYITQKKGPGPGALTIEDLCDEERFHKFHLFLCRTIKTYTLNRYRKSNRTDGNFRYHLIWNNKEHEPEAAESGRGLRICKNCLNEFPKEFGYSRDPQDFELEKFVESGSSIDGLSASAYLPAIGDRLRLYPDDWDKISKSVKERVDWECQDCGKSLKDSKLRKYLQAHHTDGDPSFNSLGNLRVLCIRCHAEQPMHGHIKNDPAYKEYCRIAGSE